MPCSLVLYYLGYPTGTIADRGMVGACLTMQNSQYQLSITHLCTSRLITPQLTMILCIPHFSGKFVGCRVSGLPSTASHVTIYAHLSLISASALLVLLLVPTRLMTHDATHGASEEACTSHTDPCLSTLWPRRNTQHAIGRRNKGLCCFLPRPNYASEEPIPDPCLRGRQLAG